VAIGRDLTPDSHLEFNYLRLDQTDVEFPGLVFDMRYLVTDGYELKYLHETPAFADQFHAEVWYNRTRFEGDTLNASKNVQMRSCRPLCSRPAESTDSRSPMAMDSRSATGRNRCTVLRDRTMWRWGPI